MEQITISYYSWGNSEFVWAMDFIYSYATNYQRVDQLVSGRWICSWSTFAVKIWDGNDGHLIYMNCTSSFARHIETRNDVFDIS